MYSDDDVRNEMSAVMGREAATALDRGVEIDLLTDDDAGFRSHMEALTSAMGPDFAAKYETRLRERIRERNSSRAKKLRERAERGDPWVSTEEIAAVLREQSDAIDRLDPTLRRELASELSKHDLAGLPDGDLAKELGRALGLLPR